MFKIVHPGRAPLHSVRAHMQLGTHSTNTCCSHTKPKNILCTFRTIVIRRGFFLFVRKYTSLFVFQKKSFLNDGCWNFHREHPGLISFYKNFKNRRRSFLTFQTSWLIFKHDLYARSNWKMISIKVFDDSINIFVPKFKIIFSAVRQKLIEMTF